MNLTLELPDDLARTLEGIAANQHTSIQQLALDRLRSLVPPQVAELQPGTAAAVLRAMRQPPIPSSGDVDEMDASIAAGRLPVRVVDLF